MGKEQHPHLKVNEPNVVHETIEGETILLNLGTGNYYSIEWPGTFVWDLLAETGDVEGIRKAFVSANSKKESEVNKAYSEFIDLLIEEELVVVNENGEAASLSIDKKTEDEFGKAISKLDKLTLNKYSDMKDMLLLDPIHDVDDKGWPEPKQDD
jgi:hypothetical protein